MNQRAKDLAMLKTGIVELKSSKLALISEVDSEDEVLELVRDMQRINVIIDELEDNYSASPRRLRMKKMVLNTAIRDYAQLQNSFTKRAIEKGKSIYMSILHERLEKECLRLSNNMLLQQEYIIKLSLAVGEDSIKDAINSKPKF